MPNPRRMRFRSRKLDDSALGTPPGAPSRTRTLRSANRSPQPSSPHSRSNQERRMLPIQKPDTRSANKKHSRKLALKKPETQTIRVQEASPVQNAGPDTVEDGQIVGENVEVVDGSSVIVTIKRKWKTSIVCPCELSDCNVLVRVGKYGDKGDGESGCMHCGQGKNKQAWNSIAELKRHVISDTCRKKQGFAPKKRKTPKQVLGRRLCHEIDNLDNFFEEPVGRGSLIRERFRCPRCGKETNWTERFAHSVKCHDMV